MRPTTFYGWYNKVVRRYPYNEKTAELLDQKFNPSVRQLTALDRSALRSGVNRRKSFKATMSGVNTLLKQNGKAFKGANEM